VNYELRLTKKKKKILWKIGTETLKLYGKLFQYISPTNIITLDINSTTTVTVP
jgi:hypothetical protein